MYSYGFKPFVMQGEYLMSSSSLSGHAEEHIGQFRVRFHYNTCGIASVMAQQVQNNERKYTFRKWNPNKKAVLFGESTDEDEDIAKENPILCFMCNFVNWMMNAMFDESIDIVSDRKFYPE